MHFETDRSDTASARTAVVEHLFDEHAKTIVQQLIRLAEQGDPTALRLCLERIIPPLRERPLQFALPPIETPADAVAAIAAIIAGIADGSLSAAEGLDLARMVGIFVETLVLARHEAQETEKRPTDNPLHRGRVTESRTCGGLRRARYKIASMPLRLITLSNARAAPVGCFAPRSNCET